MSEKNDYHLVNLTHLRNQLGVITINSDYRSTAPNVKVRGSKRSLHCLHTKSY